MKFIIEINHTTDFCAKSTYIIKNKEVALECAIALNVINADHVVEIEDRLILSEIERICMRNPKFDLKIIQTSAGTRRFYELKNIECPKQWDSQSEWAGIGDTITRLEVTVN